MAAQNRLFRWKIAIFAAFSAIVLTTGNVACGSNQTPRARKSPVILISIDTLRADHLGCYGYGRPTSPHIDEFSRDAVLFERCISQSTSTLASHGSMLTSLLPVHHGASFTRTAPLPPSVTTLAEVLKGAGYKTMSVNDGGQIAPQFGLGKGFDLYDNLDLYFAPHQLYFKRTAAKAVDWLEANTGAKSFLFLHTYETHHPYTPKKEALRLFEKSYAGPLPADISVDLIGKINAGAVKLSPGDKAHIVAAYDAEIRSMDEAFGAFIAYLKKKGLYENAVIIFTSDHGEEFGEHGIMASHSEDLYTEQTHVPLIIKFPGARHASQKAGALVRSIDIMPTLLDLLGLPIPLACEGTSLLPLARGKRPKEPLYAVSQRDMLETYPSGFWSITDGKWKLFDAKLFDLENDPQEKTDVSAAHPDLKLKLRRRVLRMMGKSRVEALQEKAKVDEALKERLRSLGYIR